MELTGDRGKLRVGYQLAAVLGKWSVIRQQPSMGEAEITMTALVTECDPFWSAQHPDVVGVWMGSAWWLWRRIEVEGKINVGATVSLRLYGDPEPTPGY